MIEEFLRKHSVEIILVAMLITALSLIAIASSYSAPGYTNVTVTLKDSYTVQNYQNVTIILGEVTPSNVTQCNPTLNANWIITDAQVCDNVNIALGTGGIVIQSGNLTLINKANVTAKGINISASGDRVFINKGSELRV